MRACVRAPVCVVVAVVAAAAAVVVVMVAAVVEEEEEVVVVMVVVVVAKGRRHGRITEASSLTLVRRFRREGTGRTTRNGRCTP